MLTPRFFGIAGHGLGTATGATLVADDEFDRTSALLAKAVQAVSPG